MKFNAGRLAFVASAIIVSWFLTAGFIHGSLARSTQQPPERPKLQKPQQSRPEEPHLKDDDIVRIGRTLVTLDVTVVDPSNKPVMDLKQDEFTVTEDKIAQKIEFFSREQVPVSLVFAIDT